LWNQPIEAAQHSEELLLMHMQQGTGTMVFPQLSMTPQMKMICLQNMQQQVKLQYILNQAWSALTDAGIRPVLMKGAGLAALYPQAQLRTWGDIDLFVGIDQYHPACAVMRDTFPKALKFDEELDHYKHYNLIADGISIEVHRVSVGFQHPIDAKRYTKMEAEGMGNAESLMVNGIEVRVPNPTFNALFVMLHCWEHATTQGANIRQFCDLALLLHHYAASIDRKKLHRWLKSLHLLDVWQLYMYILVQHLGLSEQEAPFYHTSERLAVRAERFINDLLQGKLVAPKSSAQAPKNRIIRKIHTMQERLHNARRIAQYSPEYARHMKAETLLHGALRLFAKDRHWE
jgi:hypothetical protein